MKDLLLYIARSLVEHPDDVTVTEKQGADELTLELRVAPDDMGKVIGRQGRGHDELRRSHMDPGAGMDGRQLRHRRQAGPIRKGKLFLCNNCLIRCHNQ